jgi:hypothetical protein
MYEHNFTASTRDAMYPMVCSKCGLGVNKNNTPIVDTNGGYLYGRQVPPCKYPTVPTIINQYITNSNTNHENNNQ